MDFVVKTILTDSIAFFYPWGLTSIVKLQPIVGVIIGGIDFSGLKVTVGSAAINYGVFIQAIINFLLIALTVFIIIKALSKAKRKQAEEPVEEEPAPTPEVELLTEIRDLLSKRD